MIKEVLLETVRYTPFTLDSLGKFNIYFLLFFFFYGILCLYTFNTKKQRISIQPIGMLIGSSLCIPFIILATLVNWAINGEISELSKHHLFNFSGCFLVALCILWILREIKLPMSQRGNIQMYAETVTRTFVFISFAIFYFSFTNVTHPILFHLILLIASITSHFILYYAVYYFVWYSGYLITDEYEQDPVNKDYNSF